MKYTKIIVNGIVLNIRDNETKSRIPINSKNSEYIEFLAWEAAGNVAEEESI